MLDMPLVEFWANGLANNAVINANKQAMHKALRVLATVALLKFSGLAESGAALLSHACAVLVLVVEPYPPMDSHPGTTKLHCLGPTTLPCTLLT